MPKYRRLDCNFHEGQKGPKSTTHSEFTFTVSALYDLRDQLDEQNLLARQILTVLKRMDRRMQASMPLRRGRR